nr:hypothetical protein [Roseateles saccharophilus]
MVDHDAAHDAPDIAKEGRAIGREYLAIVGQAQKAGSLEFQVGCRA